VKKPLIALAAVLVLSAFFGLCLVSALQLLAPRDMPFGVTGPSPVVDTVQSEFSLDLITYASEADLSQAAERGDIYGGYIPGSASDTLVTVPAKSFFGEVYVSGGFADAAKKAGRTFTTTVIAPLPTADRTGAVAGLLLLPTLIGGYLYASMMFPYARAASAWRRVAILLGFSAVIAVITAIVAGPVTGAVPGSHVWSLLPCFALVVAAVALAAVGLQAVLGKAGTLLVVVAFIMVGGASAGGGGVALLPTYWQHIGAVLPPRYAVELYRNVRYFDGNNILPAIAVLAAYALAGGALLLVMERRRAAQNPAPAAQNPAPAAQNPAAAAQNPAPEAQNPASSAQNPAPTTAPAGADVPMGRRRFVPKNLVAPVVLAVLVATLFAVNYMSSGHEPVAANMPFGVVGSSPLPQAAQGDLFSLKVTEYSDQAAATEAMDQGQIYGALIANASPAELIVVPSISDLSPLDIAANPRRQQGRRPDPHREAVRADPAGLQGPVRPRPGGAAGPAVVGGYVATTLLTNAMGVRREPLARTVVLRVRGGDWPGHRPHRHLLARRHSHRFVLDRVADHGTHHVTVSLFAAVLRRLLGPLGILVTVILSCSSGTPPPAV
jgi:hypothetical protein